MKMAAALMSVVFLSCFLMTGCFFFQRGPKYSIPDAIKFMEERYDDTFTYLEDYDDHQPTGASYDLYLKSKKYPDQKVYIRIIRNGDGFRYVDNYISVQYYEETRNALEEIARSVFGENFNLIYKLGTSSAQGSTYDPDMTLEEYWLTSEPDIACCLKIAPEYSDENWAVELDQLEELIKEKKICVRYSIYYCKVQSFYEETNKTDAKSGEFSVHSMIAVGADMQTEIKKRN